MSPSSTAVTQEVFGTTETSNGSQPVTKFTLVNRHGVKVQLITYGATITNIVVPDKDGHLQDVALGFDDMAGERINVKKDYKTNNVKYSFLILKRKEFMLYLNNFTQDT